METEKTRQGGSLDPPGSDSLPPKVQALIVSAIPDLGKRLDFTRTLREYIRELKSEGADQELSDYLDEVVRELEVEARKNESERRQARMIRIYGWVAPIAVPIVIGLLTGTIRLS